MTFVPNEIIGVAQGHFNAAMKRATKNIWLHISDAAALLGMDADAALEILRSNHCLASRDEFGRTFWHRAGVEQIAEAMQ